MTLNRDSFRYGRQEFGRQPADQTRGAENIRLLAESKKQKKKAGFFGILGKGLSLASKVVGAATGNPGVAVGGDVLGSLAGMEEEKALAKRESIGQALASAPNPNARKDY